MSENIRKVWRKLEHGVYVVTMGKGTEGNALAASWVTPVSSEPYMMAIVIKNSHQSAPMLKKHGAFVIHLIEKGNEGVAKTYYGPAESGYRKLEGTSVKDSPGTGSPLIPGAMAWLDCKIVETLTTGNHTVFVGEVKDAELIKDAEIMTSSNTDLRYYG